MGQLLNQSHVAIRPSGAGSHLATYVIPLAKYRKRNKNVIVTLNNTPEWYRYKYSKIKNEYKALLAELFIPEPPELAPFKSLKIQYTLLRHTRRKLDADNNAWTFKMHHDILRDLGWLVDDDQISYCVTAAQYQKSLQETMLRVSIYK